MPESKNNIEKLQEPSKVFKTPLKFKTRDNTKTPPNPKTQKNQKNQENSKHLSTEENESRLLGKRSTIILSEDEMQKCPLMQSESKKSYLQEDGTFLDKLKNKLFLKKEEKIKLGHEIMRQKVEKIMREAERERRRLAGYDSDVEDLNSDDDLTGIYIVGLINRR